MPTYPEIYVIRHGQTVWNTEGRHQGRLDSPLTKAGRAQAVSVGQVLHDQAPGWSKRVTIMASPQGRANLSAKLALAGTGITATPDERLREIDFGDWQGLTFDDIANGWPDRAALAETEPFLWHFQAPGGETLPDMIARCRAVLEDLTSPAILFTHGVTSRVLRGLWLGLDEYGMSDLPGGQGMVYHLSQRHGQRVLRPGE